jgi:hypothetical protein
MLGGSAAVGQTAVMTLDRTVVPTRSGEPVEADMQSGCVVPVDPPEGCPSCCGPRGGATLEAVAPEDSQKLSTTLITNASSSDRRTYLTGSTEVDVVVGCLRAAPSGGPHLEGRL